MYSTTAKDLYILAEVQPLAPNTNPLHFLIPATVFGHLLSFAAGAIIGGVIVFRSMRFFFRSSGAAVRILMNWFGIQLPLPTQARSTSTR